jgi:hypothetical protein
MTDKIDNQRYVIEMLSAGCELRNPGTGWVLVSPAALGRARAEEQVSSAVVHALVTSGQVSTMLLATLVPSAVATSLLRAAA